MRYKEASELSPSDFKRFCGVSVETFDKMKEVVLKAKIGKRGTHSKLSIADQILLTLQYWREYRTFFHIAQDWGVHESTACRIVRRIEDALIKSKEFRLPGKRKLLEEGGEIEVVVIDVAEMEIERPQKNQRDYYSGKFKGHTLKMQILINQMTREIIATAFGKGRRHDFNVFKESKTLIRQVIHLMADKGYQGINGYHENSSIPHKKTKDSPLTSEQKQENRNHAKLRVVVENVIRCLKIFRILSSRYRNRRKRFGLRANLIAGLYNYELKLAA